MKILYIHSLYYPYITGGAEISLQLLVEAMKLKGHEVVVLTTSGGEDLSEDCINGVTVYRAKTENIYWPYQKKERSSIDKIRWHLKDRYNRNMVKYLEEVISLEQPDIVSCHNLSGFSISIWDVLKEYKIPIVQVLHDFYFLCINSNMYKSEMQCTNRCLQCKLMRNIHKNKSRSVDAVVGISQYILDKIIEEGYFSNSFKKVIYNARVIPPIIPTHKEEKENLVFGFLGTLADNKGIKWLIDEFKKVDFPFTTLLIAGKGEESYLENLKQRAKMDSRISFLGYVDSQQFYSMVDVLVVPSLWEEPLGMVAIEACANGIPVITTGKGGLKEIITNNYNGLFIDYDNPDTLRDKIIQLLKNKDLFMSLKNNARRSVAPFIDVDRLVSEYEALYYSMKKGFNN